MPTKLALPKSQQLTNFIWHNSMNTKQTKNHGPQLISYRTLKEKVIHRFPTPFTHKAPLYQCNMPLPKIIYSYDLTQVPLLSIVKINIHCCHGKFDNISLFFLFLTVHLFWKITFLENVFHIFKCLVKILANG